MKKNKIAESLAGVIIGVFILSFVLIGIGKLIGDSKNIISEFDEEVNLDILNKNSNLIAQKINLSSISTGEDFYIYKNNVDKNFEIFTGIINQDFQYIDKYGNNISDINLYNKEIYSRIYSINRIDYLGEEKEIINVNIKKVVK